MKNKLPITRLSKFFSETDYDLNISMGMEFLHGDINMKLVLFRVDRQKTDTDDVYSEVGKDGIKFLSPVEFNAMVRINEPDNKTYKQGLAKYLEPGNLMFYVYIKHLEELKIDIKYGDYIGYAETEERIRYYTVVNEGKVISDNKHSMFGFKPYYRTVVCVPAQETEFRGV